MSNSINLSNVKKLRYHYVYQTKNLINGKTYIGRHSTNNLNDNYKGSGKMLKRAFKKYGKNNFETIVLSFFNTYEESVDEEKFLVTREYCKQGDNYNIVEGGSNPIMYGKSNPSWKGGISKDPNYRLTGKIHCFKGENNPRFGHVYSELEKDKMRKSQKCKPFYINNIFYESLNQYCQITGKSKDYIKRRLSSNNFPEYKYA